MRGPTIPTSTRSHRVIQVPVSHHGVATSRTFQRNFLRELRRLNDKLRAKQLARRMPPHVTFDIFVQCNADRSCCAAESLDATCKRLTEAVQDWTGLQIYAAFDEVEAG